MNIGLIDVDGHNYPNLPLMKLSAWHKSLGDNVEWYDVIKATEYYMKTNRNLYDKVYMSKVFSFTNDYEEFVFADEIKKGGSGYCISLVDGIEKYDKSKDEQLPYEVEHIYPDYDLYGITDTAYGFMSRGCPRGCDFCHVKEKEGLRSYKVADLKEFWRGQKNISLCDPNTLACKDWRDILQQLIDSNAYVDFNQGVDIRLMTKEKAEMIKQIKVKNIHFAFDRYQDKDIVMPKLKQFKEFTNWGHKVGVYILTNFDTTFEQDLERVMFVRSLDFSPYVMIYNKEHSPKGSDVRKLQRWCNNRILFWSCPTYEQYLKVNRKDAENESKMKRLGIDDSNGKQMNIFDFL